MIKWRLTGFTIKGIINMLSKVVKKYHRKLKSRALLNIKVSPKNVAEQGKSCPEPINKPDPYQWLHHHDREWFLLEVLKLCKIADVTEINKIEYLYCMNATIQDILITHNVNLVKGEDYFTFNWVLDLLSAAYGVPLLPNFPTPEAKKIAELILYEKLPPLEFA
jgi:hypothetical protein